MAIATKLDIGFVDNLESVRDKKIGVLSNYEELVELKNSVLAQNIIAVSSAKEGLEKVKSGELFAYVGSMATVGNMIQSKFLGDLKVAGILQDKMAMGLAVRNDDLILNQILQKTINSVDKTTYQLIFDKWITVKNLTEIDYELIRDILIVVVLIIAFFVYRHYAIKKTNEELERRVAEEVKKSRQKDILFHQQSKLATMGEMIANISHQWKQPIANISGIVMNMDYDYSNNELSKKMFYDYLDELDSTTKYMSNTIHNFMNFFSPSKGKEEFSIVQLIEDIHTMLSSTLKSNKVKLHMDKENDFTLETYRSELIQVLMILINNAKEASIGKGKKDGEINVRHYLKEDKFIIEVIDNAGGIPDEIYDRIFEPYFTTKHKSVGTGLGLHMAKDLIENALDGELLCENIYDTKNNMKGAKFSILLHS
jgi:signal transduction histidine kinase